jgi:hypothetical protein
VVRFGSIPTEALSILRARFFLRLKSMCFICSSAAPTQRGLDFVGTNFHAWGEGHPCPAIIVLDDYVFEKYMERSALVRSLSRGLR